MEIPEKKRLEAVAELLRNFYTDNAFKEMEDGKYQVELDGEAVGGSQHERAERRL